MQEIDALIERLELAPIIHRTGYLEDAAVSGYLAAADVVALPFNDGASYRRGTLMAAIQHGCAIVTTKPRRPNPDVHRRREYAASSRRSDPAALATALRRPVHIARRSAPACGRARRNWHSSFDWAAIAQATLDFLRARHRREGLTRRTLYVLGAILAAYVVLATIYSVVTPIFEASDELWHYPMVQYLATHGLQLPPQDPGVATAWRQEGSQPPLYYLMAARHHRAD